MTLADRGEDRTFVVCDREPASISSLTPDPGMTAAFVVVY
jgi:hypothetical protein